MAKPPFIDRIEDITAVAAFLAAADVEGLMLNGRTGAEALDAFERLIGLPKGSFRRLARDKTVDTIIRSAGGR